MSPSEQIQWLIHKLEVGAGSRYLRYFALVVGVVALAFLYDLRAYRNLATPEAMDAAQLARNISEGKGYTTLFLRPFSLYLVQKHEAAKNPDAGTLTPPDLAQIKTAHPDISNPPVYPLLLAGLMKVLPFDYTVNLKSQLWTNNGNFWRYQPDFFIALFNEALLLIIVVMTFFLAKKLFDSNVAWLSAILTLGCELLWRFSVSGLTTMLLLAIFMGLVLFLLEIERSSRESRPHPGWMFSLAAAAGFLTGIGALTRYAFGWAIIPVALFLLLFSGQRRLWHTLAALVAFTLVLTPWIIRNEVVSGTPFGTAGFAVVEGTFIFPQFQLERSVQPELTHALWLKPYVQKLFGNLRGILTGDFLKSAGGWVYALFFAGLFIGFRGTGVRRIRYFLLMCLGVFAVGQSLGRTQLSEVSPEVNSENLLVLLVPLVFVFGVSFFFTLLREMTLPLVQLRYAVIAGFAALCCLPMIFTLSSAKTPPVVYPPYYPPQIQQSARWMQPDELMMSDVPWAVAWYGQRQCIWITLDAQDDFFAVNSLKPVKALYLTPQTMDGKFVTEWMEAPKRSWGNFIFQTLTDKRVPDKFPLTKAPVGFFPEQMFLTDRERWPIAK
ncbi:MAG: glycosyltransferase family 39 protein [Verrucomicrobiales bacterium]|nr:glycosyltransferase family 39 protein [Verrucomicrobiales bacterium]